MDAVFAFTMFALDRVRSVFLALAAIVLIKIGLVLLTT